MFDPNTVKDSSIWFDHSSLRVINEYDTRLYVGIVREAHNDAETKELRYLVEIHRQNDIILSNCRMMRRWGGVYNYEDYVMRGYDHNSTSKNQNGAAAIPGDVVLVSQFGGRGREGVILGALTHAARKSSLDTKEGPQFKSEFNGIETSINKDGEWTLTFKGQPTNLSKLTETPNNPVPVPEYDTEVGTSFMKWDKTGSFTLSDEAAGDKIQKLFLDKKNNKMTLTTPLFIVKSDKVRLGEEGASDWLILGSKFRKEQKSMNSTVSQKLQAAKIALQIAKGALQTAGSSMAVPISGAIVAGPQIIIASTAVDQAASALGDAGSAVSTFESNGADTDYLSKVSKTK